ncbi:Callose synthase 12 [Abeliophyllum distichum]|uniref:Callose synthase 12 n=1 Tax=Abeliophyllum distichum TaxID=126358 RepID=A0ABD1PRD4_9LAMI
MACKLKIASGRNSLVVYLLSWIYILGGVGVYAISTYTSNKYSAKAHLHYRSIQIIIFILTIFGIIALMMLNLLKFLDLITSLLGFIPTRWGVILIALVLRPFLEKSVIWDSVVSFARVYEIMFGVIVMSLVAMLSWLPGIQSMQTRILFNEAFSRGLHISQILAGKREQS